MTSIHRPGLATSVAHQRAQWSLLFPNWDLGNDKGSDLAKLVVPRLSDLFASVSSAIDALDAMNAAVTSIQGRRKEWAQEYRTTQATAKIDEGETAARSFQGAVRGACKDIETHAHRHTGFLARPAGDAAGQEAALANLRSDARMVLDHVSAPSLPSTFAELVEEAIQDGDQLRAWFLSSSTFVRDYLRARGELGSLSVVLDHVKGATGPSATPQAAEAVKVLKLLNEGRHHTHGLHNTWLEHIVVGEVTDLRDMVRSDAKVDRGIA